MADENDGLFLEIGADATPVKEAASESTSSINEMRAAFDGAARAMAQAASLARDAQVDAAKQAADAAKTSASAQQQSARQTAATAISEAEKAQARMRELSAEKLAADLEDERIRLSIKLAALANETEMGRQQLDTHLTMLDEMLRSEGSNVQARIAIERQMQLVNRELVEEQIVAYRREVAEGRLSADQQKALLLSVAQEAEYSLRVREVAVKELARIEKEEAVAAAQAIVAAEREKADAAKRATAERVAREREAAAAERESAASIREIGGSLVNLGYVGGPAAGAMMNIGYILPEITKMSPGLIAAVGGIAIALTGAAAASALFVDSIKKAGDLSQQMAILGATVKAQGGDWDSVSGEVLKYATSLEKVSTYSRGDIIEGLEQLAKVGVSVSDSETIVRVAADAAAASHKNLLDVVHGLMGAEEGRKRVLTDLGLSTEQLKDKNLTLDDALNLIEDRMHGAAAAAANTLPGALSQLGHAFETLEQDIGSRFQQPLIDAVHHLTEFVEWIDEALPKIFDGFSRFGSAAKSAFDPIISGAISAGQAFWNMVQSVEPAIERIIDAMRPFLELFGHTLLDTVNTAFRAIQLSTKTTFDAIAAIADFFEAGFTDNWAKFGDDLKRIAGDIVEQIENIFGDGFAQVIAAVETAFDVVRKRAGTMAQVIAAAASGNPGQVAFLVGTAAVEEGSKVTAEYNAHLDQTKKQLKTLTDAANNYGSSLKQVANAEKAAKSGRIQTEANPPLTPPGPGKKERPFHFEPIEAAAAINAVVAAQKKLDEQLKNNKDAEIAEQENVNATTTAHAHYVAEVILRNKIVEDAIDAGRRLTVQIAKENAEIKKLNNEQTKQKSVVAAARKNYNAYGKSLEGKHPTDEQKDHLEDLRKKYEAAKKTFDETNKTLDTLNSQLEKNSRAQAENAVRAQANRDAHDAVLREYDKFSSDLEQSQRDTAATYKQGPIIEREYWQGRLAAAIAGGDELIEQRKKAESELAALDQRARELAIARQLGLQTLADELATYNVSIEQQIAYYQKRLQTLRAANQTDSEEYNRYYDEILKLEGDLYKQQQQQQADARKKILDQEQTLVDDMVQKHESLRDLFKDVWKQIEDDAKAAFEKMVLESAILKNINASIFGFLGISPSTSQDGSAGAPAGDALSGVLSALGFAPAANAQSKQQTTIEANSSAVKANTNALKLLSDALERKSAAGSASGASGGSLYDDFQSVIGKFFGASSASSASQYGLVGALTGAQAGATLGSLPTTSLIAALGGSQLENTVAENTINPAAPSPLDGLTVPGLRPSSGSGLSSLIGGAGLGAIAGQLFSSLDGGNSGYGSLGGSIGGAAGSFFGGPLGEAIGSVAGSLLGSFFGPHWGPASNYPDRSNGPVYGQDTANLVGTAGANGQYYTESSQLLSLFGNKSGIAGIEQVLATYGSAQNAPAWLAPMFNQLEQMFGESATGSGTLQFGTNIGQQRVTGATGTSGQYYSYTQLAQALNQFSDLYANAGGASSLPTPVYQVTHSLPDANLTSYGQTGVFDATSGKYTPTSSSSNDVTAPSIRSSSPTVNVTVEGSLIGTGSVDDLALAVSQSLQRIANGSAPTSTSIRRSLFGDY